MLLCATVALSSLSPPIAQAQTIAGICDRTEAVQSALLAAIRPQGTACSAVTSAQLRAITSLRIGGETSLSLATGDFAGLTSLKRLRIIGNNITALPDDIFADLAADPLVATDPILAILPAFSGLVHLDLVDNNITSLPGDVFAGLAGLMHLDLSYNNIATLPNGIFAGLTELTNLDLRNNNIATLPDGIFADLAKVDSLYLYNNRILTLPEGVFASMTNLSRLRLTGNLGVPFVLPLRYERTDTDGSSFHAPGPTARIRLLSPFGSLRYQTYFSTVNLALDVGQLSATAVTLGIPFMVTQDGSRPSVLSGILTASPATSNGWRIGPPDDIIIFLENRQPTGMPTISGTSTALQTLTAETNSIADEDGLGSFRYQWQNSEDAGFTNTVDINGATSRTYDLTDDDVGKYLRVIISFTDRRGGAETLTSAATAQIAVQLNRPATGAPTISGSAIVGGTLTAVIDSIADEDGLGRFSYQWQRSEDADFTRAIDLAHATSRTYNPTRNDISEYIRVVVSVTDERGGKETLFSVVTAQVPRGICDRNLAVQRSILAAISQGGGPGLDCIDVTYEHLAFATLMSFNPSPPGLVAGDLAGLVELRTLYISGSLTTLPPGIFDDLINLGSLSIDSRATLPSGVFDNLTSLFALGLPNRDTPFVFPLRYERIDNSDFRAPGPTAEIRILSPVSSSLVSPNSITINLTSGVGRLPAPPIILGTPFIVTQDGTMPFELSLTLTGTPPSGSGWVIGAPSDITLFSENNRPATGIPTIRGTVALSEKLTAVIDSIADKDGLGNFSYQWQRSEATDFASPTNIGTNNAEYTLAILDVGQHIRVVVSFTDERGTEEVLTSGATVQISAHPNRPASGIPTIRGTVALSEKLIAVIDSITDEDGLGSFSYQWQRSEVADFTSPTNIGSNNAEYTLNIYDVGKYIRAVISFTDDRGTEEVLTSEATAQVNAPAQGMPTITGMPLAGEELVASVDTITDANGPDNADIAFNYQWQSSEDAGFTSPIDINGATSKTYTLTHADVGKYLRMIISFTDSHGTEETLLSLATTQVITMVNICDRSEAIQRVLRSRIRPRGTACSAVTSDQLATITYLIITGETSLSLAEGDFAGLTGLRTLHLSANSITALPSGVFAGLTRLSTLWLTQSSITALPADIFSGLAGLTTLSLQGNNITTLPASIFSGLAGLTTLNLSHNDIPTLPAGIFSGLAGLTTLNLSYNDIPTLPASIFSSLAGLTTLSLNHNDIPTLPAGIFSGLAGLTTLNLSHNRIAELRSGILDDLTELESLYLNSNSITALPEGVFARMTNLSNLELAGNPGVPFAIPLRYERDKNNFLASGSTAEIRLLSPFSPSLVPPSSITVRLALDVGQLSPPSVTLGSSFIVTQEGTMPSVLSATLTGGRAELRLYSWHIVPPDDITLFPEDNRPATGIPTISGITVASKRLTAVIDSIADEDGLGSFSYQWQSSENAGFASPTNINGANSTEYTLDILDVGKHIRVVVSFTDKRGTEEVLTSGATAQIALRANRPATGTPTISGTTRVPQTLTAITDSITDTDGLFNIDFSYQWQRSSDVGFTDPIDISGATDSTYELVDADVYIRVVVSFTDGRGYKESLNSLVTARIATRLNRPATGRPTISGAVVEPNVLTAVIDAIADDDGLPKADAFRYQWQISADADFTNPVNLLYPGIGKTQSLTEYDVGQYVRVAVSFTDGRGVEETLFSVATTQVQSRGVCNRPEIVQRSILAAIRDGGGPVGHCYDVTYEHLAFARRMVISSPPLGLAMGDFAGLVGLTTLDIRGGSITNLPLGIFDDLTSLEYLRINYTAITTLPSGIFDNLTSLLGLDLGWNLGNRDTPFVLPLRYERIDNSNFRAPGPTAEMRLLSPVSSSLVSPTSVTINLTSGVGRLPTPPIVLGTPFTVTQDGTMPFELSLTLTGSPPAGSDWVIGAPKDITLFPENNRLATGTPTISGTTVAGGTLVAVIDGIADEDGLGSLSYQWQRSEEADFASPTNIGANSTEYTLDILDVGKHIRVVVSFTDERGAEEVLTSEATAQITARPNRPATGTLTISGITAASKRLTAVVDSIADEDGLGGFSYQWQRSEEADFASPTNIIGANSAEYTLDILDVGKHIRVVVSFTDERGAEEALTSGATAQIALRAANQPATGAPTISGIITVPEKLTAVIDSIADEDGLGSFSYQWQRSEDADFTNAVDVDIDGATSRTYDLIDADAGKYLRVIISFTDRRGGAEALTSVATARIAVRPNRPATGAPMIRGATVTGGTLTAVTDSIADEDGLGSLSYQWQLRDTSEDDFTDVSGATSRTYNFTINDKFYDFRVVVSFTDGRGGQETLYSVPTMGEGICGRTEIVQRVILAAIGYFGGTTSGCIDLTSDQLALATFMYISGETYLDLAANDFSGLTELTQLYLEGNGIIDLPSGIFDGLTSLSTLDLHNNSISTLPSGIFDELTRLYDLSLSENSITTLSPGIFDELTRLHGLSLSENSITTLSPGTFDGLTRLWTLDLSHNDITTLPFGVFDGLTSLRTLDLSHNDITITDLPEGLFASMVNLHTLKLEGNPGAPFLIPLRYERIDNSDFRAPGPTARINLLSPVSSSLVPSNSVTISLASGAGQPSPPPVILGTPFIVTQVGTMPFVLSLTVTGDPPAGSGWVIGAPSDITLFPGNSLPTGVPAITGPVMVGRTLTAVVDSIADENGLGSFSYQWERSDDAGFTSLTNIGTNSAEYTLDILDVGKHIRVVVSFTDERGTKEALTSGATAQISVHPNRPAAGKPTISSTTTVSAETLTAVIDSISDEDGLGSFSYQWERSADADFTNAIDIISSATGNTYDLTVDDEGQYIRVIVSFTDERGFEESRSSEATTQLMVGICGRTEAVQRAILVAIRRNIACSTVTNERLRLHTITGLSITGEVSLSLVAGDFAGLTGLRYLYLSDNSITTLEEDLFTGLTGLEDLHLNGSSITALPEGLFTGLTGLEDLRLNGNSITALPEGLFTGLTGLEDLRLNGNSITALPEGLFTGLTGLEDLLLNNNSITALPEGLFTGLTGLRYLNLNDNNITTLEEGLFTGLTGLRYLNLIDNSITTLEEGLFTGLTGLSSLRLSGNSITTLEEGLFTGLTGLRYLNLSDNSITTLEEGLFTGLTGLSSLRLSGNSITTLEEGLFTGLTGLEDLRLSGNSITTLEEGLFTGLTGLEDLRLSGNSITTLEEGLFTGLTGLEDLRLSGNSITTLEEGLFTGLTGLRYLYLSGNSITTLEEGLFTGLTGLRYLYLDDNNITTLPAGVFADIANLRTLSLTRNPGAPFAIPLRYERTDSDGGDFRASGPTAEVRLSSPFSSSLVPLSSITASLTLNVGQLLPPSVTLGSSFTVTQEGTMPSVLSSTLTGNLSPAVSYRSGGWRIVPPEDITLFPTGVPTISGITTVSETLTAVIDSIADADGPADTVFSYQWQRSTDVDFTSPTNIGEASATYTLVDDDAGSYLRVAVSITDGHGIVEILYSSATAQIAVRPNRLATGMPIITGMAQVGGELVASVDTIDDANGLPESFTPIYQWQRSADADFTIPVDISEATESTYTLMDADADAYIRVVVSFTDRLGADEVLRSVVTALIASRPMVGICDRTEAVQSALLVAIGQSTVCTTVTTEHLSAITSLTVMNASSLAIGDFTRLAGLETLSLSNNGLTRLPPEIFDGLRVLTELNLSGNALETFTPRHLYDLTELRTLSLYSALSPGVELASRLFARNSKLVHIGAANNFPAGSRSSPLPADLFAGLVNLQDLRLNRNPGLTSLPAGLFSGLMSLRDLRLNLNPGLTSLPAGLFSDLMNLEILRLNGNSALTSLPVGLFSGLASLQHLNLSHSGLTSLPNGAFSNLAALRILYLSNNAITSLPSDALVGSQALQELHLSHNQLTTLPEDVFSGLASLITINLSNNVMTSLSDDDDVLVGLGALQELHLPDNRLTTLPEGVFSGLSSLRTIDLSNNVITSLPDDVLVGLNALQELRLPNNQLPALPGGLSSGLTALEIIDLSHNAISILPAGALTGLSALRELHLPYNQLSILPAGIFTELTRLETLNLIKNRITALPSGVFARLTNLQLLRLTYNDIPELPPDIFNDLTAVADLNLSHNAILAVPPEIFDNLTALTALGLSNNNITVLPPEIFSSLTQLESLWLYNNSITTLPDGVFASMPNLSLLRLEGNASALFEIPLRYKRTATDAVADTDSIDIRAPGPVATMRLSSPLSSSLVPSDSVTGSFISGDVTVSVALGTPFMVTQVGTMPFELALTLASPPSGNGWVISAPSVTIFPENAHQPTGLPTITGTAQVGTELVASVDTIDDADGLPEPFAPTYQWQRSDNADFSGEPANIAAGKSYTLVLEDFDNYIRVVVSFEDNLGTFESVASDATAQVVAQADENRIATGSPVIASVSNQAAQGAPVITGTPVSGQTLTADVSGISDGDGLGSFSYQWHRGTAPDFTPSESTRRGTGRSYILQDIDVGGYALVVVSFTDGKGNAERLSSAATEQIRAALFTADMVRAMTAMANQATASQFTEALASHIDRPSTGFLIDGQAAGSRLLSILRSLVPSGDPQGHCSGNEGSVYDHLLTSGGASTAPCASLNQDDLMLRLRQSSEIGDISLGLSSRESDLNLWFHVTAFDVSGSPLIDDTTLNYNDGGGTLAYLGLTLSAKDNLKYGFTFGQSDTSLDLALVAGGDQNDGVDRRLSFVSSFLDYRLGSGADYHIRAVFGAGEGYTDFMVASDTGSERLTGSAASSLTFATLNFGRDFRLGERSLLTPSLQLTTSSGTTDEVILTGSGGDLVMPSVISQATEFSLNLDATFRFAGDQQLAIGSAVRNGSGDLVYSGVADLLVRYQSRRLNAQIQQQINSEENERNSYSFEYAVLTPAIKPASHNKFGLTIGTDYSRTINYGQSGRTANAGPLSLGYFGRFNYSFGKASVAGSGSMGGRLRLDESGDVSADMNFNLQF